MASNIKISYLNFVRIHPPLPDAGRIHLHILGKQEPIVSETVKHAGDVNLFLPTKQVPKYATPRICIEKVPIHLEHFTTAKQKKGSLAEQESRQLELLDGHGDDGQAGALDFSSI